MNMHDEEKFAWVRKFSPYDLYSKGRGRPDMKAIVPFYQDLVSEFFPDKLTGNRQDHQTEELEKGTL